MPAIHRTLNGGASASGGLSRVSELGLEIGVILCPLGDTHQALLTGQSTFPHRSANPCGFAPSSSTSSPKQRWTAAAPARLADGFIYPHLSGNSKSSTVSLISSGVPTPATAANSPTLVRTLSWQGKFTRQCRIFHRCRSLRVKKVVMFQWFGESGPLLAMFFSWSTTSPDAPQTRAIARALGSR